MFSMNIFTNYKIKFISSGFQRYFKNTSWLMLGNIFRMAVGLVIGIYVARYLGVEQFGLLSYSLAYVGLFSTIAGMGLDSIVVRELVKNPKQRNEILGTSAYLKLVGVVIMWVCIFIVIQLTDNDNFTKLIIGIIAFSSLFQVFNVIDYNFQAEVKSKYVVIAQIIQLIVSSIVKLYLVWNEFPLIWFVIVILLDGLVLSLCLIWFYYKKIGQLFLWKIRTPLSMSLMKDAWPLILAGVAVSLYMRIDQVMIAEMLDVKSVGEYAVAVKLSEVWNFIPMVVCASLLPALGNAKARDEKLYIKRLQYLYDLMVWIVMPIAIGMTFLSTDLVLFLYGREYEAAGPILSVYIWAGLATFLGIASSQFLTVENLLRLSMYRTLVGLVVNVGLNYVLIPIYGIGGAATSTLVSYFIATFMLVAFNKTRFQCLLMFKSILFVSLWLRIWRLRVA